MTPLQRRVECIIVQVWVSMILIHPLDVPARMWLPSAVNMVTHVECFASWAACFAAAIGSISSGLGSCERRGAEGRMRFMGLGEDISTRTGWSSNNDATKSQLVDKSVPVSKTAVCDLGRTERLSKIRERRTC